jgi:hypothetical protein
MTRRIITAAIAAIAAAAVGGIAAAQPEGRQKAPRGERRGAPAERVKAPLPPARSYEFDGDAIDGDRQRPDGTTVFGVKGVKHPSLIRLRPHFLPEILRAAERVD